MNENAKNLGKSWHQFGTRGRAKISISCAPAMHRLVLVFPFELLEKRHTCTAGGQVLPMQPANGIQLATT